MIPIDALFSKIAEEFAHNRIAGWCPLEKAFDLAATVVALRPDYCVELGVYGGKSLIPVALACEAVGHGTVFAVDPWSAEASAEGYTGENKEWWSHVDHEAIYQGFVANVKRLGLSDRVAIHRCRSDDAPEIRNIGLLSIDGQHTEQAIKDVSRFCPHVVPGGIVCADDLSWVNDGVAHVGQAIDRMLQLGFTERYRRKQENGEWGVFQRTR